MPVNRNHLLARSQQIQLDANDTIERLRNDKSLSAGAIRSKIAATHLATKRAVADIEQQIESSKSNESDYWSKAAFGITDLIGDNGSPYPASAAYRQAQAEVDKITDPREATQLLARAEQSGDEMMARALSQRAYNERGFFGAAWQPVMDAYTAKRPKQAEAISNLLANDPGALSGVGAAAYTHVHTPPEVARLSDHQLEEVANDTTYAQ